MNKRKTIDELGLTRETIFKSHVAMPFWIQLGHQEFLMSIINELRGQVIPTKVFLKIISDDTNIAHLPLEFYSNEKTVKELCEIIEKYNERLFDIFDIMWQYAEKIKEE